MIEIQEQISIISKGADEILNRDELERKLLRAQKEGRPLIAKLGLDPTAPDIHLGHTVVLRKLKQLQDLGHQVILIIGDFTGMIGDPSGRSKTRKQLTREEVLINAKTYEEQISKILDPKKTVIRFNSEWLSALHFREVIELGSKYTVSRMLEREDFKNRFTEHKPISIHEFFYPLMQAYDSVAIKADIELGGTDQRFNILMGRTIQKEYGIEDVQVALLMPLLEGTDGVEKMSKSLGNYIGIYEEPNEMYGKTMSIPDPLILRYFELATDIHPRDIQKMKEDMEQGTLNPRDAKMALAREIVRLYHGEVASKMAEDHFRQVFQKRDISASAPEIHINATELKDGKLWIVQLVMLAGFAASRGEARRLVQQGAVRVNGQKIDGAEEDVRIQDGDTLQVGKLKIAKLCLDI